MEITVESIRKVAWSIISYQPIIKHIKYGTFTSQKLVDYKYATINDIIGRSVLTNWH